MNRERVLVTGGCGFIGSNLARRLLRQSNYTITVIDNFFVGKRRNLYDIESRVELIEMDINSPDLPHLFESRKFDTVIHLAALHYIPYCETHPGETCRVNIEGTQAVLDAAVRCGVKHCFLASTAAVYESRDRPHTETDGLKPIDIYGLSKLSNEFQARFVARNTDCTFAIGRIFNVVGPGETNPHLVPDLVSRARAAARIEVGNTTSKRDYVHVDDVCDAILKMTVEPKTQVDVYNIGSGKAYDVTEVIKVLSQVLGRGIEFVSSAKYTREVDRPVLVADNSKIKREYGWKPTFSLEDSLRDAVAWPSG